MSDISYNIDSGTLPGGACPTTYQEMADLFASIYSVTISMNNTGIYVSATKPSDTTLVWKQLVSVSGSYYPTRDYVFVAGLWVSRHALEPGSIMLYSGVLPDFTAFDGGDNITPAATLISGPMWEVVAELQAKMPIGAGTLPSGKVLTAGDTAGEENHSLTVPELPPHSHTVTTPKLNVPGDGSSGAGAGWAEVIGSVDLTTSVVGGSGTPPVVTPHNNLPPYYTVNFIKRTAKQFYVVP